MYKSYGLDFYAVGIKIVKSLLLCCWNKDCKVTTVAFVVNCNSSKNISTILQ